ncbi:MAG: hypothetical protein Q9O74_08275 [Planctomycetota bacterium]|nr:hypothetical protein [Planctomycetota bacterium]
MSDTPDTLNEDGVNNLSDTGGTSRDGQAPLLLQDMQFTEEAMSIPIGSGRSRSAMVAAFVVVAAIGSLFAMRQLGLGPAVSLAEVAVEYTPDDNGQPTVSASKVLADLDRSRRAIQVPAEKINQDPFQLNAEQATELTPQIDADLARRAELERQALAREARLQDIETALDDLTLQSVMLGSRPIARINGEVYRIGMPVAEYFTITGIEGREVTLTADNQTYTLSLDTDPSKRSGSRRNR